MTDAAPCVICTGGTTSECGHCGAACCGQCHPRHAARSHRAELTVFLAAPCDPHARAAYEKAIDAEDGLLLADAPPVPPEVVYDVGDAPVAPADARGPKERVFDEQVAPLLREATRLLREAGVDYVMEVELTEPHAPPFFATLVHVERRADLASTEYMLMLGQAVAPRDEDAKGAVPAVKPAEPN